MVLAAGEGDKEGNHDCTYLWGGGGVGGGGISMHGMILTKDHACAVCHVAYKTTCQNVTGGYIKLVDIASRDLLPTPLHLVSELELVAM